MKTEVTKIFGKAWFYYLLATVLVLLSMVFDSYNQRQHSLELAKNTARADFDKDQAFREWATSHGGVYVLADKNRTIPSPWLSHIPERDIVTPSGRKLTLMNPAYMLRQMMDEYPGLYGAKGHITSMKLLNEHNVPDMWEKKALIAFENGAEEMFEITPINGKPYVRLMRPMVTKKGCLKCHGHQGYKVGDIRGGVSVSVPLAPYLELEKGIMRSIWITHFLIWSVSLSMIAIVFQWRSYALRRQRYLNASLEEMKERYYQLTDRMEEGVIALFPEATLKPIFLSARFEEWSGVDAKKIYEDPSLFLERVHPEDAENLVKIFAQCVEAKQSLKTVLKLVHQQSHAITTLAFSAEPILDAAGNLLRYEGVLTNITELSKYKEMQRADENSHHRVTRRIAGLLNNPLSILQECLVQAEQTPEHSCRLSSLEDARYCGVMLEEMIAEIKSVDAVRDDQSNFTSVDSESLLQEVLQQRNDAIKALGAQVTHQPLPYVVGNPTMMQQMWDGLVMHTLALAADRTHPRLCILFEDNSEEWVFSLTLSDPNRILEEEDSVFDFFSSVERYNKIKGVVAWSVCKAIVEHHNGKIHLVSKKSEELILTFTLPKHKIRNRE
jgi:two-component system, chemotaxis family, sensor kinase Cph1